jgi:hypothetical protein
MYPLPCLLQRNMSKKNGGWTGSALLPFVLLSEKLDSNFLVVGISPFNNLSGGEELTEEQQVMNGLGACSFVLVHVEGKRASSLCAPSRRTLARMGDKCTSETPIIVPLLFNFLRMTRCASIFAGQAVPADQLPAVLQARRPAAGRQDPQHMYVPPPT